MPKPCCTTLRYLGDSYLEDCHKGQCLVCNTIYHGHETNWRYSFDKERGFAVLLHRGGDKRIGKKPSPLARTKKESPVIEVSQLRGLSMDQIVSILMHQGINLT